MFVKWRFFLPSNLSGFLNCNRLWVVQRKRVVSAGANLSPSKSFEWASDCHEIIERWLHFLIVRTLDIINYIAHHHHHHHLYHSSQYYSTVLHTMPNTRLDFATADVIFDSWDAIKRIPDYDVVVGEKMFRKWVWLVEDLYGNDYLFNINFLTIISFHYFTISHTQL